MTEKRFDLNVTDAYEWVESATKQRVSEFGKAVATIVGHTFKGIYHEDRAVCRADWTSERMIELKIDTTLSTFDFENLTTLVVLSHDACIRMEISPVNMRYLRMYFHNRKGRDESVSFRHPTIEDAIESARTRNGRPT